MSKFIDPRFVVSAVILLYFGYSLVMHWSENIETTVVNLVMMAVGYWLGSSRGSAEKNAMIKGDGE
jgi:hypothetical protein